VVAALATGLRGQLGRHAGDNDDTTRHLSGRSVCVLAFRRRARRYGGTSRLGPRVLSKPDDPSSLKLRRDRSAFVKTFAFVKTSAFVKTTADKTADKTAGQATRERAARKCLEKAPGPAKVE